MTEAQTSVQLRVRESTAADKDGIFKLREAVYGKPFDAEEWHWKFERSPVTPAKIYVAEANGTIVGLRAFIVEQLKVHEKVWLAGLGVDIMVHPDFRRYGIASQVADEASKGMEEAGIPILTGFPNEAAFKVYTRRRSNWRHVCSIPLLVKPLNFDSILGKYIKTTALRSAFKVPAQLLWSALFRGKVAGPGQYNVTRVEGFDERFDVLWEEVGQQHGILLVRDRAFLEWRFREKPDVECVVYTAEVAGSLKGYVVLCEGQMFDLKVGLILDILAENQSAADALVSETVDHFRGGRVDAVGCLMLNHTQYFNVLRRAGFVVAPKWAIHKEFYFGVQVKSSIVPDNEINKRENWHLTFADLDRELTV